jgi:hypothetical protein
MSTDKGYKNPSFSDSKGKKSGKTISKCFSAQKSKDFFNFTSEFLDLACIDKMTVNGIQHPQISILKLQKVGQEVCGLQPSDVAIDMLLQSEDIVPSEGGGVFKWWPMDHRTFGYLDIRAYPELCNIKYFAFHGQKLMVGLWLTSMRPGYNMSLG